MNPSAVLLPKTQLIPKPELKMLLKLLKLCLRFIFA